MSPSTRAERPGRSRSGPSWVGLGTGLLTGLFGGVAVGNVVQVQRLRRRAAQHAGDLEHTAVVGEGDGAPVRLLIVGDSAARGFGLTDPRTAFPYLTAAGLARRIGRPVEVVSLATDGHRTAEVEAEQLPQVDALSPDVVVVSVGVNDVIKATPLADVEAGTVALLRRIRSRGPDVVLVPCPDLSAAPGFPWPLGWAIGWRCRQVARAQLGGAAEAEVPVARLPRPAASAFGPDGFHPGAQGHAGMAAATVAALLATRGRAWTSS